MELAQRERAGLTYLDERVIGAGMKHGALFQQAHELIHVLRILDSHCAFCAAQTRARSVNMQLSLVPGARQLSLFHGPPLAWAAAAAQRSLRLHGRPTLRAAHGVGGGPKNIPPRQVVVTTNFVT